MIVVVLTISPALLQYEQWLCGPLGKLEEDKPVWKFTPNDVMFAIVQNNKRCLSYNYWTEFLTYLERPDYTVQIFFGFMDDEDEH